ncbi:MAG: DoxX family protein [Chryseobacterium sp. SCN 40-13]|nr:MAG: DoxX family protein [Chryseobacterium sp. SCN 40-13]OJV53126.1 MAG: DoxX family protein [Bacteroidetes bacterium 43-16]
MKIVKTILFSLFGLMMLNGGLDKFLHYMPMPEKVPEGMAKDGAAFAEIAWLMPLVGFAEVLGGLLILIPRTRALGALVIFPLMVGILLTHITVAPEGLPIALVLWAILLWIIIDNRHKYLPVINK